MYYYGISREVIFLISSGTFRKNMAETKLNKQDSMLPNPAESKVVSDIVAKILEIYVWEVTSVDLIYVIPVSDHYFNMHMNLS